MQTTIVNSATWTEFQAENPSLTVKELQDVWSQVCRERQEAHKARYEAATSTVTFKTLGRIAKSGKRVGKVRLAAIKDVTATKRELERQRHADKARSVKADAAYAQLIGEAGE